MVPKAIFGLFLLFFQSFGKQTFGSISGFLHLAKNEISKPRLAPLNLSPTSEFF